MHSKFRYDNYYFIFQVVDALLIVFMTFKESPYRSILIFPFRVLRLKGYYNFMLTGNVHM